jgi:hypothetical protein
MLMIPVMQWVSVEKAYIRDKKEKKNAYINGYERRYAIDVLERY